MVSPVLIRPALVILVTAAIICIVIAISRNGSNHSAPVQSAQQLPQNIDVALKQARFSEIKDGSVTWELVSEKVEYDKSGEVAHLSGGIKIDFMRSKTRGALKVTADSGEYLSNSNNIKLRGKVHVLMEDGASFDTDSVDYTAANSQFKTADMVTFRHERLTLSAVGMEMDIKNQRARFLGSVDSTVAGASFNRAAPGSKVKPGARSTKKHISKKIKKKAVRKNR